MKVVILAGGYGTRLSTSSRSELKPLTLLDDKPIIWHIMKEFSYYGLNDFIICAGYKQEELKSWFLSYYLFNSNVKIDNIKKVNKVNDHTVITFINEKTIYLDISYERMFLLTLHRIISIMIREISQEPYDY